MMCYYLNVQFRGQRVNCELQIKYMYLSHFIKYSLNVSLVYSGFITRQVGTASSHTSCITCYKTLSKLQHDADFFRTFN